MNRHIFAIVKATIWKIATEKLTSTRVVKNYSILLSSKLLE